MIFDAKFIEQFFHWMTAMLIMYLFLIILIIDIKYSHITSNVIVCINYKYTKYLNNTPFFNQIFFRKGAVWVLLKMKVLRKCNTQHTLTVSASPRDYEGNEDYDLSLEGHPWSIKYISPFNFHEVEMRWNFPLPCEERM